MNLTRATVAEIAAASLAAVNVFETLGIDYCCGGKRPLADVCREKGIALDELVEKIETASEVKSNARDWSTADLRSLIAHIVSTHHEYLKLELPRIDQRLQRVMQAHGQSHADLLTRLPQVFSALRQELELHLFKEENMLFPAIARWENAIHGGYPPPPLPFGTFYGPIGVMEAEHDSAGEALARIRDITRDYAIPADACTTYRALLLGLSELEQDLHMHIHLENNILFPRAKQMMDSVAVA